MNDLLKQLSLPFHPSHITWKPGVFSRDKTKALALAYADLRAYQNRLDKVCGMDWSCSYTPWGDRIICNLTIAGVTRSSTGEMDGQSEKSEIGGTAAEAQSFKRACAMFSLGRYLYNLPTVWAEYDGDRRQFSEQGKSRLSGIIIEHYRRHVDPDAELTTPTRSEAQPAAASNLLSTELDALGTAIYGDQWPSVRQHNVERISAGATQDCAQLDDEALQKLINGLRKLQMQRQAA